MKTKSFKKIFIIIFICVIVFGTVIFIVNKIKHKNKINAVYEMILENNIQHNENTDFKIQDGTIGIIKIEKINFEGIVYDGTDLGTLDKGVGHFKNTPLFDGNVALAAHNNSKFWKNLNKLNNGDEIQYTSILGTRTYQVYSMNVINSNDWSKLENTENNTLTLITCEKGKPDLRFCVQALEKK